ncbi:YvrJ family protein [Metaclostridioides mangenotii]|nr:YvrJ family protein [Clostridioides mangenotii]
MFDDIQFLIANVGFPIALCMYLLIRIEGKLAGLSDSIDKLAVSILEMK